MDLQGPDSLGRLSPELHAHQGPVPQACLRGILMATAQQEGARAGRRRHLNGQVATANTADAHCYLRGRSPATKTPNGEKEWHSINALIYLGYFTGNTLTSHTAFKLLNSWSLGGSHLYTHFRVFVLDVR